MEVELGKGTEGSREEEGISTSFLRGGADFKNADEVYGLLMKGLVVVGS